jgi:thiamine biosynthesis protein ThiS
MAARVIVNGRELSVDLPSTLEMFLATHNLPPRSVVVELNGEAVAASEIATRELHPGDRLEVVRVVAGG